MTTLTALRLSTAVLSDLHMVKVFTREVDPRKVQMATLFVNCQSRLILVKELARRHALGSNVARRPQVVGRPARRLGLP